MEDLVREEELHEKEIQVSWQPSRLAPQPLNPPLPAQVRDTENAVLRQKMNQDSIPQSEIDSFFAGGGVVSAAPVVAPVAAEPAVVAPVEPSVVNQWTDENGHTWRVMSDGTNRWWNGTDWQKV